MFRLECEGCTYGMPARVVMPAEKQALGVSWVGHVIDELIAEWNRRAVEFCRSHSGQEWDFLCDTFKLSPGVPPALADHVASFLRAIRSAGWPSPTIITGGSSRHDLEDITHAAIIWCAVSKGDHVLSYRYYSEVENPTVFFDCATMAVIISLPGERDPEPFAVVEAPPWREVSMLVPDESEKLEDDPVPSEGAKLKELDSWANNGWAHGGDGRMKLSYQPEQGRVVLCVDPDIPAKVVCATVRNLLRLEVVACNRLTKCRKHAGKVHYVLQVRVKDADSFHAG